MYSEPLAYFLTWSTYGSHLHHDERGSVDRRHAEFGSARLEPDGAAAARVEALMAGPAFVLSSHAREIVEDVVREHCRRRAWEVLAVNVRTEHVHVVVHAPGVKVELVLEQLKAWSTRRLREVGLARPDQQVWTRPGSTRYCFDDPGVAAAVHYVVNEQ